MKFRTVIAFCMLLSACSREGDYQSAIKAFDNDPFPWKIPECPKGTDIDVSAMEYDNIFRRGWRRTVINEHGSTLIAKAGSPLVSARIPVPTGSSRLQFSALIEGTEVAAAVLVDVIFYDDGREVNRGVLQASISDSLFVHLRDMAIVPTDRAREVELQIRPWRDQDGIVTLRKAKAAWCGPSTLSAPDVTAAE